MIRQFKGLYSTVLLFSHCLLTVDVDTFFSCHWFKCAMIFGAANLLSRKTGEIVLCSGGCFWFTIPKFGLVSSRFLMSPNSVTHCSSGILKNFSACITFLKVMISCSSVISRVLGILLKKKKFWFRRKLQNLDFNSNKMRITDLTTGQGT